MVCSASLLWVMESISKKNNKWYYLTALSLFLVMMCNCGVGYYSISLFVTPVSNYFGVSAGDFAIVYTFYSFGNAIAAALLPFLLKRSSLKKVIIAGGVFSAAGYCTYLLTSVIEGMYVGTAFIGISTAFAGTATVQLAIAKWFVEKRSLVTGIVASASGIGSAIGSPIVGKIIRDYGWKNAYLVIGVLVVITVVVQTLFLLKDSPADRGLMPYGFKELSERCGSHTEGIKLRQAIQTRRFIYFVVGMFCVAMSYQVITMYQSSFLLERGLSETDAATCLSVFAIVDMCSKTTAGYVADKSGFRVVIWYCSAAVILALILLENVTTLSGGIMFSALLGFWPTMLVLYGVTVAITLFGKQHLAEYISFSQFFMCSSSLLVMPFIRNMYNAVGNFERIKIMLFVLLVVYLIVMTIGLKKKNHFEYREEK